MQTVMWFSSGGTSSVIHNDDSENINCLLEGSKSMVMFNRSYRDIFESDSCGWSNDGGYSLADIDQIDLEKYPGFAGAESWDASMNAGDCMYIPHRWYHQVRSFGARNLAINLWFASFPYFDPTDCATAAAKENVTLDQVHFFDEEDIRFDDPKFQQEKGLLFRHAIKEAQKSSAGLLQPRFAALLLKHGPKKRNVPHTASINWIFRLLDADADGSLSAEELQFGLSDKYHENLLQAPREPLDLDESKAFERWLNGVMAMSRLKSAADFEASVGSNDHADDDDARHGVNGHEHTEL